MSSKSYSETHQEDYRTFAEQAEVLVGAGSLAALPTSVSIFGSPDSNVGDIHFYQPAAQGGISDQLANMFMLQALQPKPEPKPSVPESTVVGILNKLTEVFKPAPALATAPESARTSIPATSTWGTSKFYTYAAVAIAVGAYLYFLKR